MSLKLGLRNKIRRSRAGGAVPILLDQSFASGATAAYSLRKLKSSATKAVRVREDSGNTETDIGFSAGTLDETALLNHCGSSNGFVTKWYDQSGNANDASNSNASEQPEIVSSGSVITENGKPALRYDGADDLLSHFFGGISISGFSVFTVANSRDTSLSFPATYKLFANYRVTVFQKNDLNFDALDNGRFGSKTVPSSFINSNFAINTNSLINRVNQFESTATAPNNLPITNVNELRLGDRGGDVWTGSLQELIFYFSDKFNNVTDIENNINNFYNNIF